MLLASCQMSGSQADGYRMVQEMGAGGPITSSDDVRWSGSMSPTRVFGGLSGRLVYVQKYSQALTQGWNVQKTFAFPGWLE